MKKKLLPFAVAICVMGGFVLSRFASSASPGHFLWRPLIVAICFGALVGALSLFGRRQAPFLAAVMAVVVVGGSHMWVLILVALALFTVLCLEYSGRRFDLGVPLAAGAGVFFVAGLVMAVPLLPEPDPPPSGHVSGDPIFLILLDAYPRPDTLSSLGVDVAPFLEELEQRGFDYYPDAHTLDGWTHRTIARMLGQRLSGEDEFGDATDRLRIRATFGLPGQFVVVAPPVGHVTIPGAEDIGPGGLTSFEIHLIGQGGLASTALVGDWIMDDVRARIERSLEALGASDRKYVFAHILSPHQPFPMGPDGEQGPAWCWPGCDFYGVHTLTGLAETVGWLNQLVLDAVDGIISRHPNSRIVIFSDHGGRFDALEPNPEWYRTLLVARTPGQPQLYADAPRPEVILSRLQTG